MRLRVTDFVPEFVQLMKRGKTHLVLSQTMAALQFLSAAYQERWVGAAQGAMALPGLPFLVHSKGGYARSIQRRQISPTVWEVFSGYTTKTGRGVTELLERGHGPIDLKPGLLAGPKSRAMKGGGRYNVVSFRHGTPGSDQFRNNPMPLSVYQEFTRQVKAADAAKAAGASEGGGTSYVTKSSATPSGRRYRWGLHYDQESQRGRRSKIVKNRKGRPVGHYTWASGKYAGMVRLEQSTARSRRGGYMTFRVVSSKSDPMSWVVPAQPPWPVRDAVIESMRDIAEGMLREALEADLGK